MYFSINYLRQKAEGGFYAKRHDIVMIDKKIMMGKTVSLKGTGLILDLRGSPLVRLALTFKKSRIFPFVGKISAMLSKHLGLMRTVFLTMCPFFFNEGPFAVDPT